VNCLDARGEFTALVDGKIGLSEWVPLEAHVAECADCRKLLDRLYSMKPGNEPQWARASTGPIELPDDHPLAQVEREAGVTQQEQIRTGEAEVRPLTGEQLHEKTVEELHEIAAHLDVSGRSEMRKDDLVEAIVEAQSAG